ncbi:MAG: hypothetical protein HZA52_12275 [Planctomycetes bacterium]|nr:hypothetical protein [Planctomycetota bacterium]
MIRAALLTDGSSDQILKWPLRWLVERCTVDPVEVDWVDVRGRVSPPVNLAARIKAALQISECQLLFVHRDAERQDPELRYVEISEAIGSAVGHVCVVPVRMQEAWLLHDENRLREAAGRPTSNEPLGLPSLDRVESLADPKSCLHDALRKASGAKGRRAKDFRPEAAAYRLAELIEDWTPLRRLRAFRRVEDDTRSALARLGCSVRE